MSDNIAGKSATKHFIEQRRTAVLLVPLIVWLCFSIAFLPDARYQHIIDWIQFPLNSLLLVSLILAGFYHTQLGLQVIIEDYISNLSLRRFLIMLMKMACLFFSLVGILSIATIIL